MAQDQPVRLDRIEAALETMQRQMDQYFENQTLVNADLRARQEIQSQQLDRLIEVAEITLSSVQGLRDEFNRHRSDGHGA